MGLLERFGMFREEGMDGEGGHEVDDGYTVR